MAAPPEPAVRTRVPDGPAMPRAAPDRAVRWIPPLAGAVLLAGYTTFSLVRHWRVESTGYDLGIAGQAVRGYAELRAPLGPIMKPDYNLLGDHFAPVLAALAPLYRLWPDIRLLLIVQALLVAGSAVVIGRLAVERLGAPAGAAVMAAYGLSWGLQGMIAFDFHEIAFGIPLVALAMCALAGERWLAAALWALPLLLVKEDLGLTVAAIGAYLCARGRWRLGGAVAAAGLAAMAVIMFVVIPSINPLREHAQWGRVSGGQGLGHALLHMPVGLVTPAHKLLLVVLLLAAVAGAAARSPLLLVALPTVGWRLASVYAPHWSVTHVHYNAILMPIVFVALIDAVPRLRASDRAAVRAYGRLAVPVTAVMALTLLPFYPLRALVIPSFYERTARAEAVRYVLPQVPDGARIAASNYLAPQLTDRAHVILFPRFTERDPVDWVVVDTSRMDGLPAPRQQQEAALRALPAQGFRLVVERDGVVLYRR